MIVVLMGVSGSGKSTVGAALARALGWPFHDADTFHPPANIAKMKAGTALTDADRWPWLDAMAAAMHAIDAQGGNGVFACSALRQAYRDRLAQAGDVRFVYLDGDAATIAARLARRQHEYMPASLLASQFDTLEPPQAALRVDIHQSVDDQVAQIRRALADGALPRAAGSAPPRP